MHTYIRTILIHNPSILQFYTSMNHIIINSPKNLNLVFVKLK